jgi:hypothetical protein
MLHAGEHAQGIRDDGMLLSPFQIGHKADAAAAVLEVGTIHPVAFGLTEAVQLVFPINGSVFAHIKPRNARIK